jgi:hypothetical protein
VASDTELVPVIRILVFRELPAVHSELKAGNLQSWRPKLLIEDAFQ